MHPPNKARIFLAPEEAVSSVEKINKDLKSHADADARWWSYNPTHRTFEIVVGGPTGNGKIVLCLTGCDHITGPLEWKNQRLEAKWIRDIQGNWHFSIVDEVAGFQAVGDDLRSFPLNHDATARANDTTENPPTLRNGLRSPEMSAHTCQL